MKRTLQSILIIASVILLLIGCTTKDENNMLTEEDVNLTDSITNEGTSSQDGLTLVELRTLLEASNSIEVKNTDNQIIGKINTGEKINKILEDIFNYTAVDDYEYSSNNVIATISFYPSGKEPIYGLIKERFIYIEGYYFVSKNSEIQKIVDYFRINTEEEPIVGD